MRISNPTKIQNGKWLVDYYEPLACGCGEVHKTIIIEQIEKPIEDEIKNKIEELRVKVDTESILSDGEESQVND